MLFNKHDILTCHKTMNHARIGTDTYRSVKMHCNNAILHKKKMITNFEKVS